MWDPLMLKVLGDKGQREYGAFLRRRRKKWPGRKQVLPNTWLDPMRTEKISQRVVPAGIVMVLRLGEGYWRSGLPSVVKSIMLFGGMGVVGLIRAKFQRGAKNGSTEVPVRG